ncbi:MAG: hypothetical protein EOP48_07200 [Sphingobacteriales bacterium]|nr:MAG: hypothetical protein EOP48_07200 [Sphingobacteriales bacterium]
MFVRRLRDSLMPEYCLLTHTVPNASLQEFAVMYAYWKNRFPIREIVIPIFMDDVREDGIRDFFFQRLVEDQFLLEDTSSAIAKKINRELRAFGSSSASG